MIFTSSVWAIPAETKSTAKRNPSKATFICLLQQADTRDGFRLDIIIPQVGPRLHYMIRYPHAEEQHMTLSTTSRHARNNRRAAYVRHNRAMSSVRSSYTATSSARSTSHNF